MSLEPIENEVKKPGILKWMWLVGIFVTLGGGGIVWGLVEHNYWRPSLTYSITEINYPVFEDLIPSIKHVTGDDEVKLVIKDKKTGLYRDLKQVLPNTCVHIEITNKGHKEANGIRFNIEIPGIVAEQKVSAPSRPLLISCLKKEKDKNKTTLWLEPPSLEQFAPNEKINIEIWYSTLNLNNAKPVITAQHNGGQIYERQQTDTNDEFITEGIFFIVVLISLIVPFFLDNINNKIQSKLLKRNLRRIIRNRNY